ncbi:preprotein translocase subunit YajC [Rhodococcus sp. X156]|uniref:preprotein translocase subunit YajC n=1 Tax=Rhodococcus sp. X156 TaxID=2499145 RepID=UPI000FD72027|nr:preprotein translocase subunit YajC [Rhodococcus sp. X156]
MENLILPLLLVALVLPMFLGRRRQQKVLQEAQEFQDSLSVGDRIMTTAGLYATVVALDEETVELEIAPGVVTTWNRMVVRERVSDTAADVPDVYDYSDELDASHDASRPDLVKRDTTA